MPDLNATTRKLYDANRTAAHQAINAAIDEAHQMADRLRAEAHQIAEEHGVREQDVFAVLMETVYTTIGANHPRVRRAV